MYSVDDDPDPVELAAPKESSLNTLSIAHSVVLILISLGIGIFLTWIVTVNWVLEQMAGIILLGTCVIGVLVGRAIYRFLGKLLYPDWATLTTAIILGLACAMVVGELTHSHKLIRDYDHYSGDNEDC
jgi:cytochrome c biogenesis protein CcdA